MPERVARGACAGGPAYRVTAAVVAVVSGVFAASALDQPAVAVLAGLFAFAAATGAVTGACLPGAAACTPRPTSDDPH